jgi:hypothetical protein
MKQKYTLTVANSQINIVTEMSKEEIEAYDFKVSYPEKLTFEL